MGEMKKPDIARRLARQSNVSEAEAADRLDRTVHKILSNLKKGKESSLPGLGKFRSERNGLISFEKEGGKDRG